MNNLKILLFLLFGIVFLILISNELYKFYYVTLCKKNNDTNENSNQTNINQ
jgi:hypothetical protein